MSMTVSGKRNPSETGSVTLLEFACSSDFWGRF